jgi:hypothetical protein
MKLLAISEESKSAMSDFEEVFKADLALTANLLVVANRLRSDFRGKLIRSDTP